MGEQGHNDAVWGSQLARHRWSPVSPGATRVDGGSLRSCLVVGLISHTGQLRNREHLLRPNRPVKEANRMNQPYSPRMDSSTYLIIALLHERDGAMILTSQEIASLTGRTRRSINKALAQLEDAGVILVDRRRRNAQDRSGRRIRLAGGSQ